MLAILLSMSSVSNLFEQRASFSQTYDSGRFGRFGGHALGFPMALELLLGIGPLQFAKFFPEDTHNLFLNAFMSGGWIAGICFPALIFITVIFGFKLVFACPGSECIWQSSRRFSAPLAKHSLSTLITGGISG